MGKLIQGSRRLGAMAVFLLALLAPGPAFAASETAKILTGREARLGVLYHDVSTSERIESGLDLNVEVLWESPEFLEAILAPRPHLGLSLNSGGDTSQIYGGLTWSWQFNEPFFLEFAFGGAIHDGETGCAARDERALGCRVLFREAISVGSLVGPGSLSLELSHISNAGLCDDNAGLTNLGLRYGLAF